MLYIKPDLFAEILGGQELRFSSPIVYDADLASCILSLNQSIRNGTDEAWSSELLFRLGGLLSKTEIAAPRRKNNAFVQKAKEMMNSHIDQVLKLDDLCQEFGLSKYQFIREFKSHAGISPYQFFLNCKVERAKQAIERSRDIYAAVADYGFADLTHLNRHFKSMFGITAYEYMSQLS